MSEQTDEAKSEAGTCGCHCGSGCDCRPGDRGKGSQWLVCGVVMLAACAVVAARGVGGKKTAASSEQGFALPVVAVPAATTEAANWAVPLTALSELNVVATNAEVVFVVIPSDDAARTAAIQKEVDAASATITGRGTKTGKYLLSKDAADYQGVVVQFGAPSILAMVRGKGLSVVADKDVTQDALLKAFVGASRSSSCGAGGCGPSGCN